MSKRRRFHIPTEGDQVTLAGITISFRDAARRMRELLSEQTSRILAEHGPKAFENPKPAACLHEAGHAVVATCLGKRVNRVYIYKQPAGWAGFCRWDGGHWHIRPSDPDAAAAT